MKETIGETADRIYWGAVEILVMLGNSYDMAKSKGEKYYCWLEDEEVGMALNIEKPYFNQLLNYELIEEVSNSYERVYRYQINQKGERVMKQVFAKCRWKIRTAEASICLKGYGEIKFNPTPIKRVFNEWSAERIQSPHISVLGISTSIQQKLRQFDILTVWDLKTKQPYGALLKNEKIELLKEVAVYNPTVDSIEEFGCSESLYNRFKKLGIERIQDIPAKGYEKYSKLELIELLENFADYDTFESTSFDNRESA